MSDIAAVILDPQWDVQGKRNERVEQSWSLGGTLLRHGVPDLRRREPLDVVAKLEVCWVTMQEAAPVPGYVCLVSQSHAVELHDLPEAAASAFMRDARRLSKALAAATGAVKLNCEIHGNSLSHLHMHFFPRYRGDQFEGQPIDPRVVAQPVYAPGEFRRIRDAFLLALDAPRQGWEIQLRVEKFNVSGGGSKQ